MLASIGPEIAGDLRALLLNGNQSTRARAVAAGALQELRDYVSADAAVAVLENENERDLLTACMRLLGEIGQEQHLDPIRIYTKVDDPVLRSLALGTLGNIGDNADIPILIDGINDDNEWAAIGAARGVMKLGGANLLEQALEQLPARTKVIRMVLSEA
jgi:HEAT repeat protein